MKKNRLKYIILGIVLLFSFKIDVYADLASEAKVKTCEELKEDGTLDPKREDILFDPGDREVNCAYSYSISKGSISILGFEIRKEQKECVILQIAYNEDGSDFMSSAISPFDSYKMYIAKDNFIGKSQTTEEVNAQYLKEQLGSCPISIEYTEGSVINEYDPGTTYARFDFGGNQNMERIHKTDVQVEVDPLISELKDPRKTSTCAELLGSKGVEILKTVKGIIQIGVPILLLVLGSLDFGKSIFSGDENEMKKSQQKFIKRVIFSVAIFLIPTILRVVLGIAHGIWPEIDATLCGIYK